MDSGKGHLPYTEIIAPMLAYSIDEPFDSSEFLFEPKWDGFRCLAYLTPGGTHLFSRNQNEFTSQFPELATLHSHVSGETAILDGEIVIFEEGKPSFHTLLKRTKGARLPRTVQRWSEKAPAVYICFDMLFRGRDSLLQEELVHRKGQMLESIRESDALIISKHVMQHGIALYDAAKAQGLEGIMAKRLDSTYLPGRRSHSWLKCKIIRSIDACIIGFTPKEHGLGSLALALFQPGDPETYFYIGHVGTGFSENEAMTMRGFFQRYATPLSELNLNNVTSDVAKTTTWIKPQTVCEATYLEFTPDFRLRHPSFVRIRPDKTPEQCTWKQIDSEGVQ